MKGKMVKNSDVSNLRVKKSRQFHNQRHSPLLTAHYLFLLLLLFSLFSSCDLFTGPKDDLFKKISDEVDWANAEKLTVRLNYPSIWGTSSPSQGSLTPALDIRKGYMFNLEFTPESAYTLGSWQVYRTAELDELGNWLENISLINPNDIEALGPNEVILPEPNASGGTFGFTILTTDPVTIIPWCDKRPRITRTEPRDVKLSSQPVSRLSDIILYFNCALDAGTVRLADSETDTGIWITAKDDVKTGKDWYYNPVYAVEDGFFTVTLSPLVGAELPASSLITATVQGIENAQGDQMDKYSFSWNTSADTGVTFKSWKAEYNENLGSINVSWEQENANRVVIYYRLNNGVIEPLTTTSENEVTILNVSVPDVSGVRGGRQITGIREYKIFIELYSEAVMESRASFKIWNMPGMAVSDTNPVVEIRTAEELAAINDNLGGQYVLANDISVTGAWMPIGTDAAPFTGKLYGAGHKITFTGSSSIGCTTIVCGLFGSVEVRDEHGNLGVKPSVIRDFTLEYNSPAIDVTVNNTQGQGGGGVFVGGVAGYLNNTNVSNIITSGGTLAVTVPFIEPTLNDRGENMYPSVSIGGIVGQISFGKIENCRAALSVNYTSNGHVGDVNIGAVAGGAGDGDPDNILKNFDNGYNKDVNQLTRLLIDGATVAADVSADKKSDDGNINIGGAVGNSNNNTFNKITFISGKTVSFSESSKRSSTRPPTANDPDPLSRNNCGGITGYSRGTNIIECSFSGNLDKAVIATNNANIGGLIGKSETINNIYNDNNNIDINAADIYIHNCRVWANIVIQNNILNDVSNNNGVMVGGVFGDSGDDFKRDQETGDIILHSDPKYVYITKCFFEDGEITINKSINYIQSAGVVASLRDSIIINNCGTRKGTITLGAIESAAAVVADTLRIGGFSPYLRGEVYNSFSKIDIILDNVNSKNCIVGGFVAQIDRGTILENCYAAGTVSVAGNVSNMMKVGGLVGVSGGMIKNCYALGNVQADNRETNIGEYLNDAQAIVGGLVGNCEDDNKYENYGLIENCFSAGQVSAKSHSQATAGGIAGIGTKIKKTAVLGKSVTAKGMLHFTPAPAPTVWDPNPKPTFYLRSTVGRINGEFQSYRKGSKNYAFNKMIIEEGEYSSNDPGTRGAHYVSQLVAVDDEDVELFEGKEVVTSYVTSYKGEVVTREGIFKVINAEGYKVAYYDNYENIFEDQINSAWVLVDLTTTRDGQDASSSTFLNQSFWKTTLKFDEGDSKNVWDFSRVAKDGHPRLKNVEGQ